MVGKRKTETGDLSSLGLILNLFIQNNAVVNAEPVYFRGVSAGNGVDRPQTRLCPA